MPTEHGLLRIQEVASELGLTTRSIRYYEEIGLLSPAARSDGAYRLYDASDVERLRFIKAPPRRRRASHWPRSASCSRTRPRGRSREALRADRRPGRAPGDRRPIRSSAPTARSASCGPRSSASRPWSSPPRSAAPGSGRASPISMPAARGRPMTIPHPHRPSARAVAGFQGWRAFRHRNYRLFFVGQLVSLIGTWMTTVAQSWLILQLTGNPFDLGLVDRRPVRAGPRPRALRRASSPTACRSGGRSTSPRSSRWS